MRRVVPATRGVRDDAQSGAGYPWCSRRCAERYPGMLPGYIPSLLCTLPTSLPYIPLPAYTTLLILPRSSDQRVCCMSSVPADGAWGSTRLKTVGGGTALRRVD